VYRLLFVLYIVRHIERTGSWKTHCSCNGLWMRNISEMLVQREGCRKKEVGYHGIEYGDAMEEFSDKTVNPSRSAENFLSSWITLHCYSLQVSLSGSVLVLIVLEFGAASLTDLFPKSWNNAMVSSSRVDTSKKKNKKWKSWTFRHLHTRPLRHLARSDTINPLNAELNPICYLLALLAHHFLHVSRIRVKSLTLRLLMSYIYMTLVA